MEEIGVVHIDEDMELDTVCIQLRKGERTVELGALRNPEPGRYVLARGEAE